MDFINRFELVDRANFLAEAGGLLANYSFWAIGNNKDKISWEDSKVAKDFNENKRLIFIDDYFSGMDLDPYVNFLKSIRGKSKKLLDAFFADDKNQDIFKLMYIYKFEDKNQYSFLLDILNNIDQDSIKDYTDQDFYLDVVLTFADFFNYNIVGDLGENGKLAIEDILAFVRSENILKVISTSDFTDTEVMTLLRALNNWQDIYKRLYPIIEKLEAIIKEDFYLVEEIFLDKLKEIKNSNYSFPLEIVLRVGFENTNFRMDEKIYVEIRLVQSFTATVRISSLEEKSLKIALGFLVDKMLKKSKSKHSEEMLQRKLKTIGDPTRFSIVSLLKKRPYYLKEMAEELHLTPATLSYHIDQLQIDGFLKVEAGGRKIYYSLKSEAFKELEADLRNFSNKIEGEKNEWKQIWL